MSRIVQPDLVTQHENAVWRRTVEGIDQITGGEGFVDHGPRLHRERQHDRGGPFLTCQQPEAVERALPIHFADEFLQVMNNRRDFALLEFAVQAVNRLAHKVFYLDGILPL